ncbi:hypothetical protein ACFWVU_00600 [Streptomyces sp. NPDC058686]
MRVVEPSDARTVSAARGRALRRQRRDAQIRHRPAHGSSETRPASGAVTG